MTGVRVLAALIMTAACGGVGYSAARTQTRRRRALAELFRTWGRDRVVLFASHDPELVQACGATVVDVAALR